MNNIKAYSPAIVALVIGILYLVVAWFLTDLRCERAENVSWDGRPNILCSIIGFALIVYAFVSMLMKFNFQGSSQDVGIHLIASCVILGLVMWYSTVLQYPVHLECFFANTNTAKTWPWSYNLNLLTIGLMTIVIGVHL